MYARRLINITGMRPNDIDALWNQIVKNDCWNWIGRISPFTGYGMWSWKSRTHNVHRFVYELLRGPIPKGLECHHTCHVRTCCNPDHIELLTRAEHRKLVRIAPTNGYEKKTHCPKGHPYDDENTARYGGNNRRRCRICERTRSLARYYRLKGT